MPDATATLPAENAAPPVETPPVETAQPEPATPQTTETVEPPPEPDKPKGGFQRRIDELTRRTHEQAAQLEAANANTQKLIEALTKAAPGTQQQPAAPQGPPQAQQYQTYEAYVEAMAEYKADQRIRALAAEAQQRNQQAQAEYQRAQISMQKQQELSILRATVEKGEQVYPDFYEVTHAPDVAITEPMLAGIATSDIAHEIFYHLGKHKDEAKRIAALPVPAQLREIGKLETRLAKPQSNAPAPIEPIGGKNVAAGNTPRDDEPMADWVKKREAALGKLRKR